MAKKRTAATPSLFEGDPTPPTTAPEFPLPADLSPSWLTQLEPETHQPYWNDLQRFVAAERSTHSVFPPAADVFNAFRYTPLESIKVFLLGQDPYPGAGQAHGLCFSVRPGVRLPASLRNIYQELQDDLGVKPVKHGYLATWARQGVMMLNACLTVRADAPNSHAGKGWEKFTDAAIRAVSDRKQPIVFLLWGAYAQKKIKLIDDSRHVVLKSAHPSPLSASNGFFGSKPFSKINAALEQLGESPIDWKLPETVAAE
ncbi:uracil-dna glycosylase : Uracil-DNA glycosylase OS=Deinococcus deserti (strain VCD115 / DSM 17065 / LMG 22923) GN=ung PE=3 SV=1: UDG [Gemmataceae bacterium]|nr:uracil-dna glycosylase : Uracil-DNA glycosylase OS=Deinococcus deserti (strain VCD115 / DSM 17065 / LMG 22923) GN=ung PE=3 SV=1: UDG [Gemmataceae bacterium]VTT98473.1 uracil-dna glycosylase : Uracil-DNA glycosylase OS=Deinococcus deserti (strain VCD115 / DSM 17065 / LMG 22923) GN=ung PE=3 SV=1: UDG [Gemmataceae bacterium]